MIASKTSRTEKTRYFRLADEIRAQITSHELSPGERLPSLSEMRARHGISQNTWDRACALLENDGLVERHIGKGTFVTASGGAHKTQRTVRSKSLTVGIRGAFDELLGGSYGALLFKGIHEVALQAEVKLLPIRHSSVEGWEKVDGVLLCDFSPPSAGPIATPPGLVCLSLLTPLDGVSSVVADDYSVGRLATEHLLSLGHRSIVYLSNGESAIGLRRLAGYYNALQAEGIVPHADWVRPLSAYCSVGSEFVSTAHQDVKRWLRDDWKALGATALIAYNDHTAFGAIEALQELGYRVPQDVSVIGCDGTEIVEYSSPRLTTIQAPLREIGELGLRRLLKAIEDQESGAATVSHDVLPVRLHLGQSTARVAVSGTRKKSR